jgi:hypothetical protein
MLQKNVAAGILPASEGWLPAARKGCSNGEQPENFPSRFLVDAFSAGLEATAHRQAGCLPPRRRTLHRFPQSPVKTSRIASTARSV